MAKGLSSLFMEANDLAILTNTNVFAIVCAKAAISANGETKNITYCMFSYCAEWTRSKVHEYIFSRMFSVILLVVIFILAIFIRS